MNIDRKTREELNALSKEVFGTSSRWQKLVNTGYPKLLTEEVEEMVPSDKEGEEPTLQKVTKPVLTSFGAKQSVMTRYTVESVRELMVDLKTKQEAFREQLRKLQEEKAAAEAQAKLEKEVAQSATGQAVV